ncbi:8651_t:CDS:2, partial [Scutellospora calospora]
MRIINQTQLDQTTSQSSIIEPLKLELLKCQKENDELISRNQILQNDNSRLIYINSVLQDEVTKLRKECGSTHQKSEMHNVWCNSCAFPIKGVRYKCGNCQKYDLCDACIDSNHDATHVFIKIKQPLDLSSYDAPLLPQFKISDSHTL